MESKLDSYNLFLQDHPPQQHSFLLRCVENRSQTAQSEQPSEWRFSLLDPKCNVVHNFTDFTKLVTFLETVLKTPDTD